MKIFITVVTLALFFLSGCTAQKEIVVDDKKELFSNLKKELDQKFDTVETEKENISQDTLNQFKVCRDAKNSLRDAPKSIIRMKKLRASFNASDYVEKIQSINSDYDELLSSMSFSIETNEEAKGLEAVVFSALSAKSLEILEQKENLNTHLAIMIKAKRVKAHTAIFIVVKDYKGIIIGINKLNISGDKDSVAEKLNLIVQKDGIEKVIGLLL